MFETTGFYDLCILEECILPENVENTLTTLYNFGYRTIAINQIITDENIEPKKKKKKGESRENTQIVPPPHNLTSIKKLAEKLNLKNLQIFNRLTIAFQQSISLHKIFTSANYKKYHIIAVEPQNDEAFAFVCNSVDVDILTFNAESKLFKLTRKSAEKLAKKGYHFEIQYSSAIHSRIKRRNIISTAHLFHMYAKSRQILISSGATHPIHLRGPYDVMNLGLILGLNQQQCRNALDLCGKQVIVNSIGRRHGKSVVFAENEYESEGKEEESEDNDNSVICLDDSDNNMEIGPVLKKSKQ